MTLTIVIIAAVAVVVLVMVVMVVFFVCYYKMKLRQQANAARAQRAGRQYRHFGMGRPARWLSPLLMAYAGQATGPANEIERFQHVKYGLLAVLLPITLSVPAYLYKVTGNVKAA